MKNFVIILLLIGLGVGAFFARSELLRLNTKLADSNQLVTEVEQKSKVHQENLEEAQKELLKKDEAVKTYHMIVGGDIMLDRGVKSRIKSLGKDYRFPFELLKETFDNADLVFANLEGSMSSVGEDTGKKYSFRFEPEAAFGLRDAGINILSLANNHMLDWGRESLCQTTQYLDQVSIKYAGAGCDSSSAEAPATASLGNTSIAILAYTEFYKGAHATETRAGMSEFNLEKIPERIKKLKQEVDVVMVSMHWGEEYKPRANDFQVATAHALVDAGADVVIGHHPHVDQQIERYKDGWIIYSLGNLVFDQSWSQETMEAILADITLQDKKVTGVTAIPIKMNKNFQPSIVK